MSDDPHTRPAPSPASPSPEKLVADLVSLLTVRAEGDDRFSGEKQPGGIGRVFGGQVVAQALQAAQTIAPEGMVAHSLHAYFLRGGEEGRDIDYAAADDFTGRSFANRRVLASQNGSAILNLTASFQRPEEGLEHQDAEPPQVPLPDELRPDMELRRELLERLGDRVSDAQRAFTLRPRPIETRSSDRPHWMNDRPRAPHNSSWFRTVAPLPDDPALHRAVIAYASDFTLLGTSALPHGLSWMRGELNGASLDHALWFHRPARADEWLLYATHSPWSGGGRGFNRGRIFDAEGRLVASVAQEGTLRRQKKKGAA